MKVVLPAPLAPSRPVTPLGISKVALSSAVVTPQRLVMPDARITATTAQANRAPSRCSYSSTMAKIRSGEVTDGYERAPARAMLRAVGMTDDDWGKPQIGVASSWNEVTPCNMPLDRLAKRAKE